jgi:2,4-dienoyl-CoA reductase-like NADH-dependent reductase (Old Yellow Enzyme family)
MSLLFSKFRLKKIEFKNRIFQSPMCQYSSKNGLPNNWHLVHLGSRAVGGVALIMVEATAVSPAGRISYGDTGIWSDRHAEEFKRITAFIEEQNAVAGIQIAHAGRKGSTDLPWRGGKSLTRENEGWQTLAPSPIPFSKDFSVPYELKPEDLEHIISQYTDGARYSLQAGFKVLEIHMAHGYLLHEFLSPVSNHRSDEYGGTFENRIKFPLRVAEAVRKVWPEDLPLFVRLSCTDWLEEGWDLVQSIEFSRKLKNIGIDLIDCSSGGILPSVIIPQTPGFQVPFAEKIRTGAGIATGAVGLITDPLQAEQIIKDGRADAVILARELLRNPYWPLNAAKILNADIPWPVQYWRAK